ncbi:MAG: prephenate dehydrogenase [Geobacteraceae bacterium GWC2_55_20]|nr:MAG: prephenate dehydrogenase [Geobacteraceae bacterium GWC2_55_20]OGU19281.1 MAG: prephenate dehydrogenase [Geobacteraceae bacterium GWF2_54_21]HCE67660.1 prephenate dehydrogenase/arogenate dehydrogenase family protein [Geobacter sp.]
MPFIIKKLAVIGTGLIGGSFALALREAGAVDRIVGIDSDRSNLERALSLGLVDEIAEDACSGVSGAEVVFISVPVCSISSVLGSIAASLPQGCIVTDGGSVKAAIVRECDALIPAGCSFVGGHPIAGTENSGATAAFAALYRGKRCVLTPGATSSAQALDTVARLWKAAGAEVCNMEPGHHDRIFAEISHLPHAIAYTLVHAVGTADVEGENVLSYTAGGFRDFTRIASSDPVMWRDISLMNRDALLASIDGFTASLAELRRRIDRGDSDGLSEFFTTAKKFRDGIL